MIGTTRDGTGGPLAGRNGFEPLRLDLATLDDADPALAVALTKAGRLDVLVNNAGYGLLGPVEAANADEIARLFAVNLFGPLALMRSVLPIMRAQRAGRIINVTLMAARAPLPATGTYAAAKAAVEALSVALAQEVEPFGIHVTSVAPGTMKTDFFGTSSLVRTTYAGSAYANHLPPLTRGSRRSAEPRSAIRRGLRKPCCGWRMNPHRRDSC